MAPVVEISRSSLLERRESILRSIGLSLTDFEERVRLHLLSDNEWAVRDELDGITFLLGEEPTSD